MKCERIQLDESAYLEAYIAEQTEKHIRKALLVIPGGAYFDVCADREGEPIALSFLPYGFNAFVLHYSVKGEKTFPAQLIQASMAMKHIKENAEKYGIDEKEIFAVGFSAGGHLAASLGTMWDKKEIYDVIDMPFGDNKPKGIMLIYPVVTGGEEHSHRWSFNNLFNSEHPTEEQLQSASIELNVTVKTCPAFIAHAANDSAVPVENSLLLAMAYSKHKVPFELHIYPRGEHGFALGNKITWSGNAEFLHNGQWVEDAVKWCNELIGD